MTGCGRGCLTQACRDCWTIGSVDSSVSLLCVFHCLLQGPWIAQLYLKLDGVFEAVHIEENLLLLGHLWKLHHEALECLVVASD